MIRLEPAPGLTVPGVGVPVPDERVATEAAVNYGWLIAVVIVAAVVITIGRAITKRIDFRLLGALIAVGFITYQVGKGN